MKKAALIVILLMGMTHPMKAFDIQERTAGKIFSLETGARALGMAGCGTLLGEAYSGLYNPAAQALTPDVNASFYINPEPYLGPAYDFIAVSLGARSEFGYLGFSYLMRDGLDNVGSFYPPEEATALILAGRPSRKIGLGVGIAFKILVTEHRKAAAIALNESPLTNYKMAFDFGLVFAGLLPQSTFGATDDRWKNPELNHNLTDTRGLSIGLAFQNIGGKVEYEDSIEERMLPQTFRADLLWLVYKDHRWRFVAVGQLQKLLVGLNENGGFESASEAFFQDWSGAGDEGGWTSRLGFELTAYDWISGRLGWSKNHDTRRSFIHYGLGLGPEWIKFNIAWENEPDGVKTTSEELRFDLTFAASYEQLRNWMHGSEN